MIHRIRRHLPLLLAALFAFFWIIARANIQSMTIDEGDSYVYFVSGKFYSQWYPIANNHILNTVLMNLFTSLFGLTEFTVRMGAVIGGTVYIASAYAFCVMITTRRLLQWPLFVCLVYNPFLMDYFVAGRGYGLAVGFLLAAWVVVLHHLLSQNRTERDLYRSCAFFSLCLGLSFSANFSFAFVDASTFLLFLLILIWQRIRWMAELPGTSRSAMESIGKYVKLFASSVVPGGLVVLFLCGWTLLVYKKEQLVVGASSIFEIWHVMISDTFYELNPQILNPLIIKWLTRWEKPLPYILVSLCLLQIALIVAKRSQWRQNTATKRLVLMGAYLTAILLSTILCHWIAFHAFGILMPKDRTSIFFVPLFMLVLGIACAISLDTKFKEVLRVMTIALLFLGVVYFVGSLRLRYFQLWKFDADVKDTYQHLVTIVGKGHDADVPAYFAYISALNFYRLYFHDNSFQYFGQFDNPRTSPETHRNPYPPGKPVYVIQYPEDENWVQDQHLTVVYRGTLSDIAIAVKK